MRRPKPKTVMTTASFRVGRNRYGCVWVEHGNGIDNMGARRWRDITRDEYERLFWSFVIETCQYIEKRRKRRAGGKR